MRKVHVFYEVKIPDKLLLKNSEVYILKRDLKDKEVSGVNVIDEDLTGAVTYRRSDHIASMHVDDVFNILVKDNDIKYFNKYADKIFSDLLIKRYLHSIIRNIVDAFEFCQRVAKKYQLNEKEIIFHCKLYNYDIYKILLKLKIINNKIIIPYNIIAFSYTYGLLKNLYFSLKLLLLPEKILFKTKLKKRSIKQYFTAGFHLFHGNTFTKKTYPVDFFINNETVTKNDVIYVVDSTSPKDFIAHVKNSNYNVIDYDDILNGVDPISYIKEYYQLFSYLRLIYICLGFKIFTLSSTLYYTLRSIAVWELFYHNYEVDSFSRLMIAGDMASSLVHKKHGVKSLFIYTQPTQSVTEKPFNGNCHDYSYMYFEILLTDNLSKYWLSNQNSVFENIIDNGSMFSDYVNKPNINILKNLKTKKNRNGNKKLVTFFDNTYGATGVLTSSNYYALLQGILFVLNEIGDNITVGLKIKKFPDKIKKINYEIRTIFEKIEEKSNFVLFNKYQFNPYNIIAASDVIVSSPMSSVIGTSLAARKNTMIFDPDSTYSYDCNIFTKFNYIYVENNSDLIKYINMNLSDKNFTFNNNSCFINKYIDNYCDGEAIQRYQKFLKDVHL